MPRSFVDQDYQFSKFFSKQLIPEPVSQLNASHTYTLNIFTGTVPQILQIPANLSEAAWPLGSQCYLLSTNSNNVFVSPPVGGTLNGGIIDVSIGDTPYGGISVLMRAAPNEYYLMTGESAGAVPADTHDVKVTTDDTTPGFLQQKIAAGPNISLSVLNPGADENLQITGSPSGVTAINANYTLQLTDASKVVGNTAVTTTTVTIPPNSAVPFPIGTIVYVFRYATGLVNVAAGAGVTINTSGVLQLQSQYDGIGLIKVGTDTWVVATNAISPFFVAGYFSVSLNNVRIPAVAGATAAFAGQNGQNSIIYNNVYANGVGVTGACYFAQYANGTQAAPSGTLAGNIMATNNALGFNAGLSIYTGGFLQQVIAAENFTITGSGTRCNFGGTLIGSNTPSIMFATDEFGNFIANMSLALQGISFQTPATGFSITVGAQISQLILDPAGTLATGTITLPAAPVNGQRIVVSSSQEITALTVSPNAGQSIKNAPTTLPAGGTFTYIYRLANTTWYISN